MNDDVGVHSDLQASPLGRLAAAGASSPRKRSKNFQPRVQRSVEPNKGSLNSATVSSGR